MWWNSGTVWGNGGTVIVDSVVEEWNNDSVQCCGTVKQCWLNRVAGTVKQ